MKRLAYTCYVAQGGDWGSPISSEVACQAPAGLLGILINLPATVPSDVGATLAVGGPAPAGLSEKERGVFDALNAYRKANSSAYFTMLTVRPQTVGPDRLTRRPRSVDSRASGLRAVDVWQDPARTPTKDDVLDNMTLYWLMNKATSAMSVVLGERRTEPCCLGCVEDQRGAQLQLGDLR